MKARFFKVDEIGGSWIIFTLGGTPDEDKYFFLDGDAPSQASQENIEKHIENGDYVELTPDDPNDITRKFEPTYTQIIGIKKLIKCLDEFAIGDESYVMAFLEIFNKRPHYGDIWECHVEKSEGGLVELYINETLDDWYHDKQA